MAHNVTELPFAVWRRDPARAQRFGEAMSFLNSGEGFSPDAVLSTYDFEPEGGTFVDVGGSHGHVSTDLARRFPKVKCIVQDLLKTVEQDQASLLSDVADRVSFLSHDFWEPNLVQGAEVYFSRSIFHDWSDLYSIKLLRALIPATRPGCKVLINDDLMPSIGAISPFQERWPQHCDIVMKAFNNAKSRDAKEWAWLLETADPHFRLQNIWIPKGSKSAFVEAEWVVE